MHVRQVIQKILGEVTHQKRVDVLKDVLGGIFTSKELKHATVGRALKGKNERSGIRKVDRLLANRYFQENATIFYQRIIELLLGGKKRPIVIVDWSSIPNSDYYLLRASCASTGRALTLYEEAHPKKKYNNSKVQNEFLKTLKVLFPEDSTPIVVTDAGFKIPWFRTVLKNGWDYIGRVRGVVKFDDSSTSGFCSELHAKARKTPQHLGTKIFSQRNPLETEFYIVKQEAKGRHRYTSKGKRRTDKDSLNYARGYQEPWLLVSSLKGFDAAKKVVDIYKTRMTIEESFRDLKSHQYGFSMERNVTLRPARLVVWLLLAALAHLCAWIVGEAAERIGAQRNFQANSTRKHRVLSFTYLGIQIIRKKISVPINFRKIPIITEEKACFV